MMLVRNSGSSIWLGTVWPYAVYLIPDVGKVCRKQKRSLGGDSAGQKESPGPMACGNGGARGLNLAEGRVDAPNLLRRGRLHIPPNLHLSQYVLKDAPTAGFWLLCPRLPGARSSAWPDIVRSGNSTRCLRLVYVLCTVHTYCAVTIRFLE